MTKTKRVVLVGIVVAALAACTSTVVRRTTSTSMPATAPVSTPKYGATAQVQRGDTLYGIAFRNGIDVRDLAEWNSLSAPYTIYPGQRLRLYPRDGASGTATRPVGTETRPASPSTAATPGAIATTTTKPATPPATATPATQPPAPKPAPVASASASASDIRWRWPADGALLSRFVGGEPTKQGIDIAGASGASVKAAADGVVVYSGAGLVGYGELVIIKHNDAWLSAYGHNRARLVNEGAIVKAGQQIAVMGRTGAPRDMLHFEIRHNGKPVDPLLYLPKR